MEISDIITGITIRLDELFPDANIYTEKIEQGFTTPALTVQFINFNHTRRIDKRWIVTPMFSVQYFPEKGAIECADANLKIQQGLDTIKLINDVEMLARGATSNIIDGPNGEVIGQNFARFEFFLQKFEDVEKMMTLEHFVNKERVTHIV